MPRSVPARIAFAIALVSPITLIHYVTDVHAVELHNVYRRLYYIPIVLGAFAAGVRGGIGVAIVAILGYLPHAFFSSHPDPAPALDKALEMVLYVAIGTLTGWLVEQQRKVEEALQRSLSERDALEEQLVRAGKLTALGELSAGLAHEIRNPLASILGAAESLTGELDPGDRKYRLGQLMIREVHRLNGVVSRFSTFARSAPVEKSMVDVMELAREVCDLSEAEAQARGIDVEVGDETLSLEADGETGHAGAPERAVERIRSRGRGRRPPRRDRGTGPHGRRTTIRMRVRQRQRARAGIGRGGADLRPIRDNSR